MYIVEVIPIARAIGADTLSYFSRAELPLGALVDVPLRSRTVRGVVSSVRPANEVKADIKQATFALKKIGSDKKESKPVGQFFSKEFMETVHTLADYYASTAGSVLAALVPETILKKASSLEGATHVSAPSTIKTKVSEVHAIQGDDGERYGSYRAVVRQEFAKKLSVFICLPTAEDASRAYRLLEKGIEGYIFLLHNALPQKKIIDTWNAAVTQKHPIVIIATGGYLCIPREDVGTLIVERENSRNYKSNRRPFIDIRRLGETFAKKKGIGLVYGDMLLTAETLWREAEGDVIQSAAFQFRSLSTASDTRVDMRQYKSSNNQFKILAEETEALIRSNKENNEHMIVLAARRGIAPSVVCADCQTIVTCNECSSPAVLHRSGSKVGNDTEHDDVKHFFMCHRCGARRSSEEYCKICGSWKLGTVGIGIDLVADKIRDKFPGQKVFQIDSDTTKTEKQIHAAVDQFKKQPGSILLGTEMMLTD